MQLRKPSRRTSNIRKFCNREPVRLKDDGTIGTLYDSFECRHAAVSESFKGSVGVHQKVRSFWLSCNCATHLARSPLR